MTSRLWSSIILLALCGLLLLAVWFRSGQLAFPYPLDDSYIHLSIARNLPDQHAFTIDPNRKDFSSSSPIFSLALALLFKITTPTLWWSLILGIAGGIALLTLLQRKVRHVGWIWAMIILSPIPLLMVMGMEHIWQVVLAFAWMIHYDPESPGLRRKQVFIGFFLVLTRYEGLFLIGSGIILALWKGHWKKAAGLAMSGGIPTFGVGVWSWLQGGTWLPLSLLVKGNRPELSLSGIASWGETCITQLYEHPYMFVVLSISAAAFIWGQRLSVRIRAQAWILQLTGWGQILLGALGGYRYDAWLILLHLYLLYQILVALEVKADWKLLFAGFWPGLPLLIRSAFFTLGYPTFVSNIYHQSVQVASFIDQAGYQSVAVHDIGAVSWMSAAEITDLAMIGDGEIFSLYRQGQYTAETLGALLVEREVELIVIQPEWAGHLIPDHWLKAGTWTIPDAVIVPYPSVAFYAPDSAGLLKVKQHLVRFSSQLPAVVDEGGAYTGP